MKPFYTGIPGAIPKVVLAAAASAMLLASPVAADVLNDIRERGSIRLGHRTDAPPFSYLTEAGTPAGLAISLCREIARNMASRLGLAILEIEFVPVTAKTRFDVLIAGQTDLHCGPASATLSRREMLDFSILYFVDGAVSLVRPGELDTVFDMTGGDIGVNAGTTTEGIVRDLIDRNGIDASLVTFDGHEEGLTALADGDVEVYFGDSAIMRFQVDTLDLASRIRILPEEFSFEPYAIAMNRGEGALRLEVDRALSDIYDKGQIYNLVREELGDYRLSPLNRAVYQIVGLPG